MFFTEMETESKTLNINSELIYRMIINSLDEGILIVQFLVDKDNKVYDSIILEANDAIQKHTGFNSKKVSGKLATEIFQVLRQTWVQRFNEIVSAAGHYRFEEYSQTMNKWLEVKTFPLGQNNIYGILVADITLRKQNQQLLADDSELSSTGALTGIAHCKIIVDSNGDPIDYEILRVNDNYSRIIGIRKEDTEGKKVSEVFPGEYGNVALKGSELNTEVFFEPTKQYLAIHAFSLVPGEFIIAFRDISASKQIEISHRVQKEILQTILNSIPVMITIYEPGVTELLINEEFVKCTGWTQEEIHSGNPLNMVYPDPEYRAKVVDFMQNGKGWQDITMTIKDGSTVESSWANIKIPGGRQVGIGIDIRERKKAEETLQKSVLEKEFLMKEVHHRVKNNLQIIASLLRLQMETLENQHLQNILLEGSNRIKAIAMIHEKLYSGNLETVRSTDYIPELVSLIQNSYRTDDRQVDINLQITPLNLKIDNAVYLGLLINEILTNSFKHAFHNRKYGEINVSLNPYDDEKFELKLSDNGEGYNTAIKKNGLGLVLIKTLVEQLEGTSKIDKTNGTEYHFIIKK